MAETTTFDDLMLLDGNDLRVVFQHLGTERAVAALWGCSASLRRLLLRKMPRRFADELGEQVDAAEHFSFTEVLEAQRAAVQLVYELSRAGVIAFDAPEDMVA